MLYAGKTPLFKIVVRENVKLNKFVPVFISLIRNTSKMSLPRVFFDMSADDQPLGRIVMEVKYLLYNCTFKRGTDLSDHICLCFLLILCFKYFFTLSYVVKELLK